MNLNMKEIGKRISERRKKLGIKQNILAEKLDISNNHMSGIENGKATPSVALFVKICDELNVTLIFCCWGVCIQIEFQRMLLTCCKSAQIKK